MASKRLDFPTPFAPATQVKGPKRTSTSTRFLNPLTRSRVSMRSSKRFLIESVVRFYPDYTTSLLSRQSRLLDYGTPHCQDSFGESRLSLCVRRQPEGAVC